MGKDEHGEEGNPSLPPFSEGRSIMGGVLGKGTGWQQEREMDFGERKPGG